jgi:hypothetical protein
MTLRRDRGRPGVGATVHYYESIAAALQSALAFVPDLVI